MNSDYELPHHRSVVAVVTTPQRNQRASQSEYLHSWPTGAAATCNRLFTWWVEAATRYVGSTWSSSRRPRWLISSFLFILGFGLIVRFCFDYSRLDSIYEETQVFPHAPTSTGFTSGATCETLHGVAGVNKWSNGKHRVAAVSQQWEFPNKFFDGLWRCFPTNNLGETWSNQRPCEY